MNDKDRIGDDVGDKFNAGKDGTVLYYISLPKNLQEARPDSRVLPDVEALVQCMVLATG